MCRYLLQRLRLPTWRGRLPYRSRTPTYHFWTPSLRSAASSARRYRLGLWENQLWPKGNTRATSACTLEDCRQTEVSACGPRKNVVGRNGYAEMDARVRRGRSIAVHRHPRATGIEAGASEGADGCGRDRSH